MNTRGLEDTGVQLNDGELLGDVAIAVFKYSKSWLVARGIIYLNNSRV